MAAAAVAKTPETGQVGDLAVYMYRWAITGVCWGPAMLGAQGQDTAAPDNVSGDIRFSCFSIMLCSIRGPLTVGGPGSAALQGTVLCRAAGQLSLPGGAMVHGQVGVRDRRQHATGSKRVVPDNVTGSRGPRAKPLGASRHRQVIDPWGIAHRCAGCSHQYGNYDDATPCGSLVTECNRYDTGLPAVIAFLRERGF